jgi:hypothetical protein
MKSDDYGFRRYQMIRVEGDDRRWIQMIIRRLGF